MNLLIGKVLSSTGGVNRKSKFRSLLLERDQPKLDFMRPMLNEIPWGLVNSTPKNSFNHGGTFSSSYYIFYQELTPII